MFQPRPRNPCVVHVFELKFQFKIMVWDRVRLFNGKKSDMQISKPIVIIGFKQQKENLKMKGTKRFEYIEKVNSGRNIA